MAELTPAQREEHNRRQLRYFEETEKPRMLPTGSPYLRRHVDELVSWGGLDEAERVLEVGAGMGRYTLLLAERGVPVEALDLSPLLLERLRAFDGGRFNVPVHAADVLAPPEQLRGRFDAVVALFTLHHLHDLAASFRAMSRLLRKGGRVVFLEPNPLNPLFYVQIAATPGMTWRGDGGIVRMRPKTVFAAMSSAGFSDLALRRFGFFPPFAANEPRLRPLEQALERRALLEPVLPFQLFRGRISR